MIQKVKNTLLENAMAEPGHRILVGVSGGPDSVALLHALLELGYANDSGLGIAHVHHGMRGQSADRDAAFVESLAKNRNLPYHEKRVNLDDIRKKTGISLEEAGRNARYGFFEDIADRRSYDRIAVGHHLDDDAELILMNILRGSGPTGMAGIPPVRGRIVRPLIHCRREDIRLFLKSCNIAYVHDKTNDNIRFRRNHIRHCLIPSLVYYNPRVAESLHKLGQISAAEEQWIDRLISPVFETAVSDRGKDHLVLDLRAISAQHPAAKRRIARKAVLEVKGNLRRIGLRHIDEILGLMEQSESDGSLLYGATDLPESLRATRTGDFLAFRLHPATAGGRAENSRFSVPPFSYAVMEKQAASGRMDIPEAGVLLEFSRLAASNLNGLPAGDSAAVNWEMLEFPLVIRNVRPGDRFIPLGMKQSQKLKKFFINNKIPRERRSRIPILISGGRVVWVAGFRIDERFKITRGTETVLRIKRVPAVNERI